MPSTIKMNREELVKIMKTNRDQHVKIFNNAVQEYLLDLEEVESKNLKTLKKAIATAKPSGSLAKLWSGQRSAPTAPSSYEDQYNTKIAMFDASVDAVIELDEQEFKQYVLDQWGWKHNFTATTASYNNKLMSQ